MKIRANLQTLQRHSQELARLWRGLTEAKDCGDDTGLLEHELQHAVTAAREHGVGWTAIGNALGMRSGQAYARFRP